MLSKVSNSSLIFYKYYFNDTISTPLSAGNYANIFTSSAFSTNTDLIISLDCSSGQIFINIDNSGNAARDNNNTIMSVYKSSSSSVPTYSGTYTIQAGQTLYLKAYANPSTTVTGHCTIKEKITEINKTITTHKSKPRELKNIGEKARGTLYGYHTNNSRYTGE